MERRSPVDIFSEVCNEACVRLGMYTNRLGMFRLCMVYLYVKRLSYLIDYLRSEL